MKAPLLVVAASLLLLEVVTWWGSEFSELHRVLTAVLIVVAVALAGYTIFRHSGITDSSPEHLPKDQDE